MHLTAAFTLVLALLVTPISSQTVGASCRNTLDVVFVVDGSNSVNPYNYRTMVSNLSATPDRLDLGVNWTRMGVVLFSAFHQLQVIPLQFNATLLKPEILEKLNDYPDTTTDTDKAIERATSLLVSAKRVDVPQVIVLMTDGQGNFPDRTLSQIRAARMRNIAILTVGMNYIQENLDMTIDPARDMFVLSQWSLVIDRLVELSAWHCKPPVCTQGLDLMFVLDGSNSVFHTNFEKMVNSVGDTTLAFWNLYNQSRIGVVVFSTTVTDVVPLTSDPAIVQNRLKMLSYPDLGTFTWLGIEEATRQLLSSTSSKLPKVMVVITDGDSENQEQTIKAAERAKAQGITIYGIGVGTTINPAKLAEITSADAGQVKLVQDFGELTSNLTKFVSGLCHAPPVIVAKTSSTTPLVTFQACNRPVDVFFLMDTLHSAGNGFAIMASTLARAARSFIDGSGQVRLMAFSSNVTYNRGAISSQDGLDQVMAELSSIVPSSGPRATDLALRQAATDIQDRLSGRRPNIPLALLVILTGSSQRPAEAAITANLLVSQQGVKVFSLGVTNNATDAELMSLTFNVPGRWARATDYAQLPAILNNVSTTICATA